MVHFLLSTLSISFLTWERCSFSRNSGGETFEPNDVVIHSILSIIIAVDFEQLQLDRSEVSQRSVFGISWVKGVHTTLGSLKSTLNTFRSTKNLSFITKSLQWRLPPKFNYQRLISNGWLTTINGWLSPWLDSEATASAPSPTKLFTWLLSLLSLLLPGALSESFRKTKVATVGSLDGRMP